MANPIWTISHGATFKTFAALKLGDAPTLQRLNQQPDVLTFTAPGADVDSDPLWAFDTLIQVKRAGVLYFQGRVQLVQRIGEPVNQGLQYTVLGPWKDLEDLVYQQSYKFGEANNDLSRITFFESITGTRASTATTMTELITYAAANDCNLSLGTNLVANIFPPKYQAEAPTVAEAIRRVLAWHPDVIARFDYSAATPVLHFIRNAVATAHTWTKGQRPLSAISPITKREDLKPAGVVVKFVYTTASDEEEAQSVNRTVAVQTAGTTTGRRVIRFTFPLDPGFYQANYQQQRIRVATLPTDFTAAGSYPWWRSKVDWLSTGGDDDDHDVTIDSITHAETRLAPLITVDPPYGEPTLKEDWKPRELIEGIIPEWMSRYKNVYAYQGYVKARIKYTDAKGQQMEQVATVKVNTTNGLTGFYKRLESANGATPETPPSTDLAAHVFNAYLTAFDGNIQLIEEQVSGGVFPGDVVNLLGGREEWETMRAPIQSVTENWKYGTTDIVIGIPGHLSAYDLQTLLKPGRITFTSPGAQGGDRLRRKQAENPGENDPVEGGGSGPRENSSAAGPNYVKFIAAKDHNDTEVDAIHLDSTILDGAKIEPWLIPWCQGGVTGHRWFLASDFISG